MDNNKTHNTLLDIATLRKAFRERMAKRVAEGSFMHNAEVHCIDGSITLIEMPNMRSEIQRLIIRTRPGEDAILVFHASELWVSELPLGDPRMAEAEKAQREGTIDQLPWVQECVDIYEESLASPVMTAVRAKIHRSEGAAPCLGDWSELTVVTPRPGFRRYLKENPRVIQRPDQSS